MGMWSGLSVPLWNQKAAPLTVGSLEPGPAWCIRAGFQAPLLGCPRHEHTWQPSVRDEREPDVCSSGQRAFQEEKTASAKVLRWGGAVKPGELGRHKGPRAEEQLSRGELWKMRSER